MSSDQEGSVSWILSNQPVNNVYIYGEKGCLDEEGGEGIGMSVTKCWQVKGSFLYGMINGQAEQTWIEREYKGSYRKGTFGYG